MNDVIEKIRDVPGALDNYGPLARIIRDGIDGSRRNRFVKHPLYVIQEALIIHEACPQEVKSFNRYPLLEHEDQLRQALGERDFKRLKHVAMTVKFDIQTSDMFIRCITMCWLDPEDTRSLADESIKRMADTFEDLYRYKVIADALDKIFQVRFQHKLSDGWRKRLEQKAIQYLERNCGRCTTCLD